MEHNVVILNTDDDAVVNRVGQAALSAGAEAEVPRGGPVDEVPGTDPVVVVQVRLVERAAVGVVLAAAMASASAWPTARAAVGSPRSAASSPAGGSTRCSTVSTPRAATATPSC
mgnify:CR=1 FL=1